MQNCDYCAVFQADIIYQIIAESVKLKILPKKTVHADFRSEQMQYLYIFSDMQLETQ